MKIRKAILWGVPVVVMGSLIYWLANANFRMWSPMINRMPAMPALCQWLLSIAWSIAVIILAGYGVTFWHPMKKIIDKFPVLAIVFNGEKYVKNIVLVKWGGNEFYGWLTGTVRKNEQILFKITVPTAPLPISAQLMLVERKNLEFSDVGMADHLQQLGSMGFVELSKVIKSWEPPENE